MNMKHIAQAALGVVASVAVSAASAAAPTGNAAALINQAMLAANEITLTTYGTASYTSNSSTGNLALTAAQATTTSTLIDFANADGFKLAGSATVSFLDLSYNTSTQTLNGVLKLGTNFGLTIYSTGPIANANSFSAVADSTDGVSDLLVGNFTLDPLFADAISAFVDPSTIPLGSIITSITFENYGFVAPVPEPSTYALMGLGLVGVSLVARRRQA
jgi:PEP-CTERM motif